MLSWPLLRTDIYLLVYMGVTKGTTQLLHDHLSLSQSHLESGPQQNRYQPGLVHKNYMLCWYCWIIICLYGQKFIPKCTVLCIKVNLWKTASAVPKQGTLPVPPWSSAKNSSPEIICSFMYPFYRMEMHESWENLAIVEKRTCLILTFFPVEWQYLKAEPISPICY